MDIKLLENTANVDKYYKQIWDILVDSDNDFVPKLSSRETTLDTYLHKKVIIWIQRINRIHILNR